MKSISIVWEIAWNTNLFLKWIQMQVSHSIAKRPLRKMILVNLLLKNYFTFSPNESGVLDSKDASKTIDAIAALFSYFNKI